MVGEGAAVFDQVQAAQIRSELHPAVCLRVRAPNT